MTQRKYTDLCKHLVIKISWVPVAHDTCLECGAKRFNLYGRWQPIR